MSDTIPTPPTILLTKREAGEELRISERSVHDLIKHGLLPAVRFGGNVRVDRADLLAFIQKSKGGNNG